MISPLAALNAREAQLVRELARLLGLSLFLLAMLAAMLYLAGVIMTVSRNGIYALFSDESMPLLLDLSFRLGQILDWARQGLVALAILCGLGGLTVWWLTPGQLAAARALARWPLVRRWLAFWDWRRLCAGLGTLPLAGTVPPPRTEWARLPAVRCQAELSQLWANDWQNLPAGWPRHWAGCPRVARLLLSHRHGQLTLTQWAGLGAQMEQQVDDCVELWRVWLCWCFLLLVFFFIALTAFPALVWLYELLGIRNRSHW